MNLSLDEYRALVAKAFRGVGYPWGLTEDASWAARRLAELDGSSPAAVVGLLDQVASQTAPGVLGMPEADWTSAKDRTLCPICVGTSLLDRGASELENPLTLGATSTPELLVPFLSELLSSRQVSFVVEWSGGASHITAQNIVFYGQRTRMSPSLTITSSAQSDLAPHIAALDGGSPASSGKSNNRVILDVPLVQRLEQLAHRTYAPATDASRAGAGAGTTDND